MQVSKKLENGKLTLVVSGRLDTNTSPELEAELSFDGVSDVVFDFGGLEYISSAGLRVLLTARKALMPTGGNMSVINANDTVRGVLEITELNKSAIKEGKENDCISCGQCEMRCPDYAIFVKKEGA